MLLAGLWWWRQVPSLCTFRFVTAVLLVNITVYKQKNYAQSLNCVRLRGAEWSWWSPLGLICALGFVNSTVLSSWLFFHMDVSDQGIAQLKNCALSVTLIATVFGVDTFSPPNPSWFIWGHSELWFIMFSVVGILLYYKKKKKIFAALARLIFFCCCFVLWKAVVICFFPLFEMLHWMFCRNFFYCVFNKGKVWFIAEFCAFFVINNEKIRICVILNYPVSNWYE